MSEGQEPQKPVVAYLGPVASYTNQVSADKAPFVITAGTTNDPLQPIAKRWEYSFSKHDRLIFREAALASFPEEKYDLSPQATIQNVFRAVQHQEATHGVVPFENSTNGSVIFTLDLLADKHDWFPDVEVEAEIYLAVEHVLAGTPASRPSSSEGEEKAQKARRMSQPWRRMDPKADEQNTTDSVKIDKGKGKAVEADESSDPSGAQAKAAEEALAPVKPLYSIDHVKTVYSHPQAWGQCNRFYQAYLQNTTAKDISSTSQAATDVAKSGDPSNAAICSRLAAQMNNLTILADGIQDDKGNCTRFLVLRSRKSTIRPLSWPPANSLEVIELATYKSLLIFTVSHTVPGALASCLSIFSTHGLNLTNFTSRPSGAEPFHYTFFVEFRGRRRPDGKGAVNEALKELDGAAQSWKFVGSWEDWMYRRSVRGEEGYKKV